MLHRKEASSRDRKSNIEKGGGGSIVELRCEICLRYSKIAKCLNSFGAHCKFAKVCASVYGISFILFLSPLPVLQKQVVTLVPTQRQETSIYISSCELLPLNSQSDVDMRY